MADVDAVKATRSYEAWADQHVVTIPEARLDKHHRMAGDPFAFLRGTYYLWVQRLAEILPKIPGPVVLAVGDLHVENFGTWRDAEGRLAWGINDLDETDHRPAAEDLLRLAASAHLAERGGVLRLPGERIVAALLDGYAESVARAGIPVVLDAPQPPALVPLLPARHAQHWWARLLDNPLVMDPSAEVADLLSGAMPPGTGTLRFLRRCAGMGSRDHERIVALADLDGAPVVREAKALAPPATWWAFGAPPNEKVGRAAARLSSGIRHVPDPFLRIRHGWVVRRLAPWSDRIELADLHHRADAESLVRAMGQETANAHLASASPDDLRGLTGGKTRRWLVASSLRMVETVEADWSAWRAHHAGQAAEGSPGGAAGATAEAGGERAGKGRQ